MLRLTAFEFIVRAIPESFVYILAGLAFSNNKINAKKYIISSILLAMCIYFIRMLPINYGVHTILIIIIQITILTSINKIDIIRSVKSSIITIICLFIFETLNMLALGLIFKKQLEVIMLNPILKTISGLPSLICFAITILGYYYNLRKRLR